MRIVELIFGNTNREYRAMGIAYFHNRASLTLEQAKSEVTAVINQHPWIDDEFGERTMYINADESPASPPGTDPEVYCGRSVCVSFSTAGLRKSQIHAFERYVAEILNKITATKKKEFSYAEVYAEVYFTRLVDGPRVIFTD